MVLLEGGKYNQSCNTREIIQEKISNKMNAHKYIHNITPLPRE